MGKEGQDCDKIHNFQVYRNYTMYICTIYLLVHKKIYLSLITNYQLRFQKGWREGGGERKNLYKNYYSRLFEQSFVREICNEEFRGNFAKIEKKKKTY